MRIFSRLICLFAFLALPFVSALAQKLPDTTRLLRFPTTNGRQVVFCYAGQLYTVAKEGDGSSPNEWSRLLFVLPFLR
jgi:tricorn protease